MVRLFYASIFQFISMHKGWDRLLEPIFPFSVFVIKNPISKPNQNKYSAQLSILHLRVFINEFEFIQRVHLLTVLSIDDEMNYIM